ncbi:hypothetical protein O6H91_18G050900 [Diphasiastrum complanatum]|uniref:Uncharacterized protein n=1 Tax=Diphasiastrum complanatum TaxID=34168 RepID=A0ACC2B107_DIPCM|nr:hypothetical protein O6H91_18G050900 [Diphasiastrum complanatum]
MSKQGELQLAEIGRRLGSPSLTKDASIKLLKQLASLLPEVEQSSSASTIQALKPCMDALILPSILKHKDKDVRVLVATCLSEIMRIRAPDAPYNDDILQEIFQLIVSTFQGLDEVASPAFARRVSILDTVAKVKTCVLMLDLECDDLIHEMFTIFFAKVREDHPQNVFTAMRTIMALVLQESFEIPQPLLDQVLSNLLKDNRAVSAAAHNLAVAVVQSCAEKLETYIQRLLTSVMLEGKAPDSVLHGDYHDIIYEIYCCAPQMLLAVIPNLSQEILTDNVDVRLKAVDLLGRLFSFPGRHVAQEYRQLFSEFLKRFTDKAVEVRLAMVECSRKCLMANPMGPEASEILSALNERLLDFDDKVRMVVVKAICDLAKANFKWVPMDVMKHVADRLRDKKIFVRKDTLQNLTEVYATYCTKCYEGSAAPDQEFEWIPGKILRCCYDKDCKEFRPQGIEIVLTDELFHSELPVEERVKHWIAMFSNFDKNDKKALERVLSQKKRLQQEMQIFLSMRQKSKQEEDASELKKKIQASSKVIAASFVDSVKAEENLQKLFQMKDNNIFKALGLLLTPGTTFDQSRAARVDLLKRIGEKHPQHEFMRILATKCSFLLFGKEHVIAVLKEVKSLNAAGNKELVAASLSLLVEFSGLFPVLVDGAENDLLSLLREDGDDAVKEGVVHVLAKAGSSIRDRITDVGSSLDLTLENLCLEGSRKQAKYAVSAIAATTSDSGLKALSVLYGRLVDSLEDNNHLATKLQSLSCIAQNAMPVFETREDEIIRFVVRNLLRRNSVNLEEKKSNWESKSKETLLKIYGIKTLVKSFLPNKDAHLRQRLKGLCGVLLKLLQSGEIHEDVQSSEIDKAHLRLAAAKGVLRLSRKWDLQIPAQLFHLTVLTAQDPSVQVRRQFLLKANQYLREHALSNKYASTFALSAADSAKDVLTHSKRCLAEFVETSRREARLRQVSASVQVEGYLLPYHPEYVLVYLLHVLAHHPSFPASDEPPEDASVFEPFYRQLSFFLRALLQQETDGRGEVGKKDEVDNLPAILEIFRTIKRTEDATETPRTNNIHLLCDIGLVLAKDLGRKKSYSGAYPGEVPLPSMFYKAPDLADVSPKIDGSHLPACLTEDVFVHFHAAITTRLPQPSSPRGQKRAKRNIDESSSDEVAEDCQRNKADGTEEAVAQSREIENLGVSSKLAYGKKKTQQQKLTLEDNEIAKTLDDDSQEVTSKSDEFAKAHDDEADNLQEATSKSVMNEKLATKRKRGRPTKESRENQASDRKRALKDKGTGAPVRKQGRSKKNSKIGIQEGETLVHSPRSSEQKEHTVAEVPVQTSRSLSRKRGSSGSVGGQRTLLDIFQSDNNHTSISRDSVEQTRPEETVSGRKKELLQARRAAEPVSSPGGTPRRSAKKLSVKDVDKSPSWKNEEDREASEKLVGCRIRVWWPLDKRFYEGKVTSYDPTKQKHKVLYDDGDEETLRLVKERWELVVEISPAKKDLVAVAPSLLTSSSNQHGKQKKKTSINALVRESDVSGPPTQDANQDEHLKELEADEDNTSQIPPKVASNGSTEDFQSQAVPGEATGADNVNKLGDVKGVSTAEGTSNTQANVNATSTLDDKESDDEPLNTWRSRRRKVH